MRLWWARRTTPPHLPPFSHVQELVFDHSQCAVVLASRLSQHDIVVFGLAFAQDALDHIDFIFADLQFDLFFKKLDHALQNDV